MSVMEAPVKDRNLVKARHCMKKRPNERGRKKPEDKEIKKRRKIGTGISCIK